MLDNPSITSVASKLDKNTVGDLLEVLHDDMYVHIFTLLNEILSRKMKNINRLTNIFVQDLSRIDVYIPKI